MSAKGKVFTELLKAIVSMFGKEILVATRDKLKSYFKKYFKNKNILILGSKQTGKTSLILFLQHGIPYEIGEDGEIEPPNPTAFTAVVDKKVPLNEANWAKVKRDLPGDKGLRETWQDAIDLIKPHGIIYLIDGRLEEGDLIKSIKEMYEFVLKSYVDNLGNLNTLHIFLNFSDQWVKSNIEARSKLRFVESEVDKVLMEHSSLQELKIESHLTQLSPNKKNWSETYAAIIKFGADLQDS